jgi:tetratricopeptide (TPR) repeat protein
VLPLLLGLLLLAAIGVGAWWWSQRDEREMQAGIAAYRAGRTDEARTHFTAVARNSPDRADPHVFLARMARDEGNLPGALSELQTAIRLDQANPLALREMGAYLYTVGRYDLARNFYIRALAANPGDREAQGYLGCSMLRLGRVAEGQRFLQRAGQGTWSQCMQQAMPPQPGMLPPPR